MKRILFILVSFIIVLSACSTKDTEAQKKTETNYYLSLNGESEHWKLDGYEIMMTPKGYKAGNGTLKMKGKDEQMGDFFSFDVYGVVDGKEDTFQSVASSVETDVSKRNVGTIEGDSRLLKDFPKLDEIYMTIKWNDDDSDDDQDEEITLYNKNDNDESFLDS